jgi:CHAT domain-containing protein/Tfp pilus assembly protein PilF
LYIRLEGDFTMLRNTLFRSCLLLIGFGLSSFGIVQNRAAASPIAIQASDEATLGALVEEFYAAYAKKDVDGWVRLWSARATDIAARRKALEKLFADHNKIEVKSLSARKAKLQGEHASLRIEVELSATEAKTGNPARGFGRMMRSFSFVKEDGVWRIWQERSTTEELAAMLATVKTAEERSRLLQEEKEFLTAELVRLLIQRGNLFRRQGDYAQSLALYQLGQSIAEQLGDQTLMAGAIHMAGITRYFMGDSAAALVQFQKSMEMFEAQRDKKNIAMVLNSLGNIHSDQGNYRLASEYLEKAKQLTEEIGDQLGLAQVLTNIGIIQFQQGNFDLATELYEKSLAIETQLGNKYNMAGAFHNIGMTYSVKGDYTQALAYYQRTLAIGEELKAQPGIALTLANIAGVYRDQRKFREALENYEKSLAIYQSLGDRRGMADALKGLADAHYALGAYAEAIKIAERGIALASEGNDLEFLWKLYLTAGRAYQTTGQTDKAQQLFEKSVQTIETLRSQIGGNEQTRQNFLESRISPYHQMVDFYLSQNQPDEAFSLAERAKARVLLDTLQSGKVNIIKAMSMPEQERERELKNELIFINSQVTQQTQSPQPDQARLTDLKAKLQKARLNYEEFQANLYAAHPELKVQRGQTSLLKPEEATSLIADAKGALLEFLVIDERVFLFVLTKKNEASKPATDLRTYSIPIRRSDLASRVQEFRQQLANRDLGFRVSARALYDLLLRPAQAQLQGKTNLVIVPDDCLWELPFQALQPTAERYVIEEAALSYAPSLSVLREMIRQRQKPARPKAAIQSLLAFGNPALKSETVSQLKAANRDEKLEPLPEAEKEVKALAELYGTAQSKIYIGAEAREDRVKAQAGKYAVLHFATHGIFNNASPMYSHLVLSPAEGNEDGLLEAWEILKLDLQADMVVLSACETARGQLRAGEGLIGLTWALFVAGSPTTVVSQWKVDSSSTSELMVNFYRTLRAAPKTSKSEALRVAALTMLKRGQFRHPFYWAGFVIVGDGA